MRRHANRPGTERIEQGDGTCESHGGRYRPAGRRRQATAELIEENESAVLHHRRQTINERNVVEARAAVEDEKRGAVTAHLHKCLAGFGVNEPLERRAQHVCSPQPTAA